MSNEICDDCNTGKNVAFVEKPYDPLDVKTFRLPPQLPVPSVTIEFCDRCRWLHRATWTSTELMITFPSPILKGVYVVPLNSDNTAGQFRIWLSLNEGPVLIWDRKCEGGFPELKHLKQRIRDKIQPERLLGHSEN